jgi:hypothetical protein
MPRKGDTNMTKSALQNGLAILFGIALLFCIYVLLFRDTSNATHIVAVITLLIGGLLLTVIGEHLSELKIGPLEAKLRDLDDRVNEQQEILDAIRTAIEGIVTRFEYDKLVGLERDGPFMCNYHENLLHEMKQLYDHGFVKETEFGSGPKVDQYRGSSQPFDLKNHFVLAESGEKYLQCRREWQIKN